MAILITGGAGYIGSHTAVELLNAGKEIVILDNFYNSCREVLSRIKELAGGKDFKFYECDIRDRKGLDKVFKENDIESHDLSLGRYYVSPYQKVDESSVEKFLKPRQ